MLGWDKKPDSEISDDITELMIMIRRKSGDGNALHEKPDSTQELGVLSSEHLEPLHRLTSASVAAT